MMPCSMSTCVDTAKLLATGLVVAEKNALALRVQRSLAALSFAVNAIGALHGGVHGR